MWFFMYMCYLGMLTSFVMLLLNGLQGYFHFAILNAHHATFAILTVIVYLFTESLVIFFFVGIGVSIKEYVQTQKLDTGFHHRSIAIKRKIYPPLLFNMLIVMVLFITGGAVDTARIPAWSHGILFYFAIFHLMHVMRIQHRSFRESTEIVLEMSGLPVRT